jgi:NADPH:quinone reductase
MDSMNIPETHQSLYFKDYLNHPESCQFKERPTLKPREDQVLVQMAYASINPSDLMFLRGLYGIKKKLPLIGGFEGSGVVVSTSEHSRLKIGDRVAVVAGQSDGTWSEYMLTSEESCIPLLDSISLQEGATLFVNPVTCYAMFEKAIRSGAKALVQSAAASALGKMLIRLAQKESVPLINIVRKESQVESLKDLGAEYVLNSEKQGFEKEFFKMARKWESMHYIDAVGGELTTRIFPLLPPNSTVMIYGNLSEKDFQVSPGLMIFQNKRLEAFWLTQWIGSMKREEFLFHTEKVQSYYKDCFETKVQRFYRLEEGYEALLHYQANMSQGKVLFKMIDE